MKHIALTFTALLLLTAPAFAAPELPVDSRIRVLTFAPQDVYTVPTKYGYQTSIVFAKNEEINTVSVGDRSMWQIIPSGNRIFIRPMDDALATNMTVITNQREYNFDIKSVEEGENSHLYVVQFRYPDKMPTSEVVEDIAPPPLAPVVSTTGVSIPPLDTQRTQQTNTSYTYSGPDAIAPADVYDDGKNTYVVYATMPVPAPKPMIMNAQNQPVLAAHRVEENRLVILNVVSGLVLTHPAGDITVYNEMFQTK